MLKALLKAGLQSNFARLSTLKTGSKKRSVGNKLLVMVAVAYIAVSVSIGLGSIFHQLLFAFSPAGLTWLYFATASIMAFVLSLLGSVYMAQQSLFEAKDNDLLLSLPIPTRMILSARMIALYLTALLFELVVLLPAFVVFLIWGQASAIGVLLFLLASLLMPLLVLALSCLLGWGLALLTARMKHKNLIIIVLSLVFLAAYFYGYSKLMSAMGNLVNMGTEVAMAVQTTLFPAYHFGLASLGSLTSFLLFAVCALLPFGLVFWLLSSNYTKVITTKYTGKKAVYKGGGLKAGGQQAALVKKELRRLYTSPMYLLNTSIGLAMMLALPVVYVIYRDSLLPVLDLLGVPDAAGVLAVAAICTLLGMTFISAPSVSLEGNKLWILQTLPVKPLNAFLAKVQAHVLVSMAAATVTALAFAVLLKTNLMMTLLLFILPFAFALFTGYLGLHLNLRFPKMRWRNEVEPVKQSMSSFLAMTLGVFLVPSLAALYGYFLIDYIEMSTYLLICACLLYLLSWLMHILLRNKADRVWQELSEA